MIASQHVMALALFTLHAAVMAAPSALYFQTNDAIMNSVVAIAIDTTTGMLTSTTTTTATKGKGSAGTVMVNGTSVPATSDGLFSQSSLTSGANCVFVVNAGSNTLSMFKADPMHPTKLTLVGKPRGTLGQFPMSVAFSSVLMVACVLNGGAKAGVACFHVDRTKGLTPMDKTIRSLSLGQTTPPHGPTDGSSSQLLFNPKNTALIAVLKGNAANGHRGNLAIYSVDCSSGTVVVGRHASIAPFNSTNFLFGSAFASDTRLVTSDPATTAETIDINFAKGTAALAVYDGKPAITKIAGQVATCWAAYAKVTKTVFLADAGSGIIYEIDPFKGGMQVGSIDARPMNVTGVFDMAVRGKYLYSLAPRESSIVVANVVKGTVVQVQKGMFPPSITGLALL